MKVSIKVSNNTSYTLVLVTMLKFDTIRQETYWTASNKFSKKFNRNENAVVHMLLALHNSLKVMLASSCCWINHMGSSDPISFCEINKIQKVLTTNQNYVTMNHQITKQE